MKTSRIRSTLLREVGNLRSSPRSALPSPPSSTLLEGRSSDFNGCSALHVQLIAILQAVSPKLLLGTLRINRLDRRRERKKCSLSSSLNIGSTKYAGRVDYTPPQSTLLVDARLEQFGGLLGRLGALRLNLLARLLEVEHDEMGVALILWEDRGQ